MSRARRTPSLGALLLITAAACGGKGSDAREPQGAGSGGQPPGVSNAGSAGAASSGPPSSGGATSSGGTTVGGQAGASGQAGAPGGTSGTGDPCAAIDFGVGFSLERGWYQGDQTLSLSACPAAQTGGQITYALGGALPSMPYTGPILIGDNGSIVTVRARLTLAGVPGRLQTHTFVFLPDVGGAVAVVNDNDLPVAPDEIERTVTFEFIPSPKTGLVPVSDEAGTATNMQGQSSGKSDKLYFRREYGKGRLRGDLFSDLYYGVKPTDRHDHLFLRSDHTDKSMLRNVMAHDALSAMGQLSPHGRFADFYDNGVARGTRYLVERPEGGFMESYTSIDKGRWIAVNGLDAIGTTLDPSIQFASWDEASRMINVTSLVDFLLVQWHAGVSDYEPLRRNWRGTGPTTVPSGPEPEHRWHFFNWDIDRGYMRDNRIVGSPMNIWQRVERFPEAHAIFQERVQCAFSNGGPLTTQSMLTRLRARFDQLMKTSLLLEVWEETDADRLAPGTKPTGIEDFSAFPPKFVTEMETWLVARERIMREEILSDWMLQGRAPAKCF